MSDKSLQLAEEPVASEHLDWERSARLRVKCSNGQLWRAGNISGGNGMAWGFGRTAGFWGMCQG